MGIPSYFGIDKKDIVILAIKSYKNRPNWTDDYVEDKYKIVKDGMLVMLLGKPLINLW